jgi:hypothetical protein
MSRSYKKYPVYTDGKRKVTKYQKRQANKAVRKYLELADGMSYKKCYCSYNIHDYKAYETLSQAIKQYQCGDGWSYYKTLDEMISAWFKYYHRK